VTKKSVFFFTEGVLTKR